jgi:hypothetical protein
MLRTIFRGSKSVSEDPIMADKITVAEFKAALGRYEDVLREKGRPGMLSLDEFVNLVVEKC